MNESNKAIVEQLLNLQDVKKISINVNKAILKVMTKTKYEEQRVYREFKANQNPESNFWKWNLKALKRSNIERAIAFQMFKQTFKRRFPEMSLIRLNWRASYFWKDNNNITALAHKKYSKDISHLVMTKSKEIEKWRGRGI